MKIDTMKLKQARAIKGWSQEVLAKASGLSLRTIQRIETNQNASTESILSISAALEISADQLRPTQLHVSANWNRRNIMQGFVALAVITIALGSLFVLAAPLLTFVSGHLILYTLAFFMSASIVAFGVDGLVNSIKGWRYLFSQEIKGGAAAAYLAKIYAYQIRFAYGGAIIVFSTGVASIHGNPQLYGTERIHEGYTVLTLAIVYAAILSEAVFRPLKAKLETCDMGG